MRNTHTFEKQWNTLWVSVVLLQLTLSVAAACGSTPPDVSAPASAVSIATQSFGSYEEAIRWVRSNSTLHHEDLDTGRSSWIQSADYYSDHTGLGFLILSLNGRMYIHQGVPESVWREFQSAESLGRFYNQGIKGRYQLHLDSSSSDLARRCGAITQRGTPCKRMAKAGSSYCWQHQR